MQIMQSYKSRHTQWQRIFVAITLTMITLKSSNIKEGQRIRRSICKDKKSKDNTENEYNEMLP